MRLWVKLLLLSLMLVCVPTSAQAAIKYVDNSGAPACSDVPGNGSEAAPWCTVNYGLSQISGGDTMFIKAGTYQEFVLMDRASGTSGNPTIIQAFPGHAVKFLGVGGHTGRCKLFQVDWVVFDGFEITDYNQGLFVEESNNIIVQNLWVHDVGQEAIHVLHDSNFVTVQDNLIHDTRTWDFNGEGIYVGTGSAGPKDNTHDCIIRNNVIFNIWNEGIELKPGTHDCLVEDNLVHDAGQEPSWPNFGGGGIQVDQVSAGAQDWPSNPNHVIRNNIVYNSKTALRAGTGSTWYNNVVYDVPVGFFGMYVDNMSSDSYTRVIYHNTIDKAAADAVKIVGGTTDVKNNIGPSTTNNVATNDAFYFDVANDDYHIVVGSTPVDAGLDLTSTVPTDIEGKTRPSVTPDYGAYELGASPDPEWYAASCSSSDVQAAVDESSDGEEVLIPPGSCTYTTSVGVQITNKGIVITGAGIGVTNITNGIAAGRNFQANLQSGDPTFVLTGITFNGNGLDTGSQPLISMNGGGLDAFRLHGLNFTDMQGTSISVNQSGLEVSGLIDNNTLQMNSGAGDKSIRLFGADGEDSAPFARGLELGSEKFIFIEDNTFNYAGGEDGALDAFGGARYVFRHNTVNETDVGHHGADSGNFRGVHSCEIYENVMGKTSAGDILALSYRSATGVAFNNTFTGNYSNIGLSNFRSRQQDFPPWGQCNGSSSWDENQSGESGYACLDQIGHTFTESSGGSNILNPLYLWSNSLDGSPMGVVVTEASMENHIKPDRDYYVEDAAFNGTSGIGVGLLSARPATCTPDVGYWATDENKLYRCTSTDTWTLYYEPFTYPHPLQGAGGGGGNGSGGAKKIIVISSRDSVDSIRALR